jgi:hypothetical protein
MAVCSPERQRLKGPSGCIERHVNKGRCLTLPSFAIFLVVLRSVPAAANMTVNSPVWHGRTDGGDHGGRRIESSRVESIGGTSMSARGAGDVDSEGRYH